MPAVTSRSRSSRLSKALPGVRATPANGAVPRSGAAAPRTAAAAGGGGNFICMSGLPPALGSLGEMVGLLQASGTQYCLNPTWFTDPIGQTAAGFSGNGDKLASLLAELLGEVSGQAAGVPISNAALVGTWYPIEAAGEPTGLYVGSYPDSSGNQIFGIAAYVDWNVPAASPVLTASAWLMVPLLGVGNGGIDPVLTKPGYPITLGVAVDGADSKPLVDTNGFSFNGVKVSVNLDVAAPSLDLSMVVLQLQLPGESKAQDRSLASLETISSQEIMNTASALFISALSYVSPTVSKAASFLLPVMGLSSIVPGNANASLPTLGWDQLLAAAQGGNPAAPFVTWFQQIAGTPANLQSWLGCIGGFLGQNTTVTGAGTADDPFSVPILTVASVGTLSFTASAVVNPMSQLVFYPGLQFGATPIKLETSSAVIQIVADAQLFQFTVATQGGGISPSSLSFDLGISLEDATAGTPLISANGYAVDKLSAGLSLGASLQPVPSLTATNVVTPGGKLGTVDLLSPGQLAQVAETAIQAALVNLLGIIPGQVQAFVDNCAALLGIQSPTLPAGLTWPAALAPPFSAAQIGQSIQNPVAALANYYLTVISNAGGSTVGGQPPFYYLVCELAGLLQDVSVSGLTIAGSGTADSPWTATISQAQATLPAALTVYSVTEAGVTELIFGVALDPQFTVGGLDIALSFDVDLLALALPEAGSGFSGTWLPNVNVSLSLPNGFQSSAVAGVSVQLASSSISAGWAQTGGWYWSLIAGNPTITIDGTPIALGQDLDFGNQTSLQALVTSQAPAFVNMLAGMLGAALVQKQTRAGLALAGTLGLLKNIGRASNFPPGLQWPSSMPTLALTGFTDPRPALLAQISGDFASQQNGAAVLSLLAWAVNGSLTSAPSIAGAGTFGNPYQVPLTGGFNLLVWYNATGETIGLGLGRAASATYSGKYQISTLISLNAIEVSLATGQVQTSANTPSLSFITTIASTGGMLVPGSAQTGSLGQLQFGCGASFAGGTFQFSPIVNLIDVTLPGETQQALLELSDYSSANFDARLQQAFVTLVDAGIRLGIQQVSGNASFQTVYSLLTSLGLALPRSTSSDPYGINPAGWQALLANPLVYAEDQLESLLADPTLRATFFDYLQQQTGVQLPTIPAPVLQLLSALGFAGDAAHGHPLLPRALLQLAQSPFGTLSTAFENLADNPAALSALATELAGNIPVTTFGPFTFQSTNGGSQISLEILPANAVTLAGLISFAGQISLNLSNFVITASTTLFNPDIGLGVESKLSYQPGKGAVPSFTLEAQFGDGSLPSAPAVTIYPFNSTQFVSQLAAVAPAYVLSTVATMALESTLLQKYPLAQEVFAGFGIAQQKNGVWTMPSLLGLLYDPVGWLLSDQVLGEDGRFSIAAFGTLLSKIPAVTASNGVAVKSITSGIQVSGLPYNFALSFTATSTLTTIALATSGLSIASGKGTLQTLSAGITLDASAQPGFVGEVGLATASLTPAFYVDAGYTQTAAAAEFSLTVGEGTKGSGGIYFQILPFQGFGSLLQQALQQLPAVVLQQVIPEVLTALSNAGAGTFVTALQQAGTSLNTQALVTSIVKLPAPVTVSAIEQAALTWLLGRFSSANMSATASAVATLLKTVLPTQVSSTGGLVTFNPNVPDLPIILLAGVNSQNLAGVWIELQLNLPGASALSVALQPSGVGVPISGNPTPQFSFGVDLTVPVEGTVGPQLNLSYNPAKGIKLAFDPLGDAANLNTPSTLSEELLPAFFGNPPDRGKAVTEWLIDVVTQVLPRYVAAVVLQQNSVVIWLNDPIVSDGPTPGNLLVATSVLQKKGANYTLTPLSQLLQMTIPQFLGNLLQGLLQSNLQLLTFPKGGGISIGPDPNNAGSYGMLLAAPDLAVPKLSNVVLQLGANNKDWIENSGGDIGNLKPGISVYLPITGSAGSYHPNFSGITLNLVNVGMDFAGTGSTPLVNLSRFQLGAVKPRTLLQLDMNGSPQVSFGAGVTLSDIAISVAPNSLIQGDGGNAVAANLLGSGSDSSQKNPPANPKFTVEAAYTKTPWVNLSSGTANGNQIILPVQRTFGPLDVNSVGLGWVQQSKLLQLLFDGSVALAGLEASVDQLTVGIPVTTITDFSRYTLDLKGLDVSFNGGGIAISGGFLKTDNPLSYTGAALVKAASFSLIAIGSYAVLEGAPSLFIFGALLTPLGGPPAFFVTGIAAGFAFNRGLKLPGITGVQDFPLVKGVIDGTFQQGESPESALEVLNEDIPPEIGEYWLAAGVKFTSFSLLDSFALLFVEFGKDGSILLLGLTSAPIPKGPIQLAYVELAIQVAIRITEGIFSAEAQLTPNSYIIAKDCKLTGGFAFYLWFKDITTSQYTIHAGDFVVSLGGYHPAFKIPAWYPKVPRLGFNWLIDAGVGTVKVAGGAYFAITGTAVMAGGYLGITFNAGPLNAWFDATANFLVQWKPFYYVVDIGVSVGVSFQTTILGVDVTLSVELGADMHLEGPPTQGYVHVSWYIISFTIPFGEGNPADQNTLNWSQFAQSFLPPDSAAPKAAAPPLAARSFMTAAPAPTAAAPVQQVVKFSVQNGLLKQTENECVVRAVPFSVQVASAIPTTSLTLTNWTGQPLTGPSVGVRPMGLTSLNSPVTFTIINTESGQTASFGPGVALNQVLNGAPGALWSRDALDPNVAPTPDTLIIPGTLMGAVFQTTAYITFGTFGPFPLANIQSTFGQQIQIPFATTPNIPPSARFTSQQQAKAIGILEGSIMNPTVIQARNALFTALQASGIEAPLNPSLSVMAAAAHLVLQQGPVLAHPAIYQTGTATISPASRTVPLAAVRELSPARAIQASELTALWRSYRVSSVPAPASAPTHPGLLSHNGAVSGRWMDSTQRSDSLLKTASADNAVRVSAGTVALWKLDARASHTLETQGNAPLRLVCFDAHGEILSDLAQSGSQPVPARTGMVAMSGVAPTDGAILGAWQLDSRLIRVNHYYGIGEGCVLRTQNILHQRHKGRTITQSAICAWDMVAGNFVQDVSGLQPGWVETIFPLHGTKPRSFAIATGTSEGAAASLRVTAAPGETPGLTSQDELTPDAVFDGRNGSTILVFAVPEGSYSYLSVIAHPRRATSRVLGVYLLDVPVADVAGAWSALTLTHSSPMSGTAPPAVRAVLRSKKEKTNG